MAVNVKTVLVAAEATVPLEQYGNVKLRVEFSAELGQLDDAAQATAELFGLARAEINRQASDVLAKRVAARVSVGELSPDARKALGDLIPGLVVTNSIRSV